MASFIALSISDFPYSTCHSKILGFKTSRHEWITVKTTVTNKSPTMEFQVCKVYLTRCWSSRIQKKNQIKVGRMEVFMKLERSLKPKLNLLEKSKNESDELIRQSE
jgi:hypothetical protein